MSAYPPLSRAHAAQLGLPGLGGVDPLDAAESAAAVRSATNLRSISRTSGSVVRSTASEHSLARRQYSAACELMEPVSPRPRARPKKDARNLHFHPPDVSGGPSSRCLEDHPPDVPTSSPRPRARIKLCPLSGGGVIGAAC